MKILVVDDSMMQQKIARIYLENGYGHTMITANNGVEGIEKAGKDKPDLILLDLEMPVMGGMQVLVELKKNPLTTAIPVVMCTAADQHQNECIAAGAAGYLKKPHGYSALYSILQAVNGEVQP